MHKRERVLWLDYLRFAAIIAVILIHVLDLFITNHSHLNPVTPQLYILLLIDALTRFAVPAFFMITGALQLHATTASKKRSLGKTIQKMIIPFIIISAIIYIYNHFYHHFGNYPLSLGGFVGKFANYPGVMYHTWFIYVMAVIYIFLPIIQKLVQNLSRSDLKYTIITIFVLGNVVQTASLWAHDWHRPILMDVGLSDIVIFTNYLLLGYYLTKYQLSTRVRRYIYAVGIASVIIMPFTRIALDDPLIVVGSSVLPFFMALAAFTFCQHHLAGINLGPRVNKFVVSVSSLSLYIYLLHPMFLEPLRDFIIKIPASRNLLIDIPIILAQTVVVFLLSLIAAKLFSSSYSGILRLIKRSKNHRMPEIDEIDSIKVSFANLT